MWHLCIDELHMEGVITAPRDAHAVGLCATCCRHTVPLASGADVETLAQRMEEEPVTYHAATLATVVFLAPHTADGCGGNLVWVIPTCGNFKAEALPCTEEAHGGAVRQC